MPALCRQQPLVTVIRAKLILNAFRKSVKLALADELCNEHEPIQMHEALCQPRAPANEAAAPSTTGRNEAVDADVARGPKTAGK